MTICNITGTIVDSNRQPMDGALVVTIDSSITSSDDKSIEFYPAIIIITAGVIDINLEETETHNITYKFDFYRRRDGIVTNNFPEDFDPLPIPSFHAIVPNLPTYDWSSLRYETGITTANMSTSALAIVREMLTNQNLQDIIFQGLGIYKTNTVPTGISADRITWIEPENHDVLHYDTTTARWFTDTRQLTLSYDDTGVPFSAISAIPFDSKYTGIRIVEFYVSYTQSSPATGSANHQIESGIIPANTTTRQAKASIGTNNGVVGQRYQQGFVDDTIYLYADINQWYLDITANNSPGALIDTQVTLNYQYVL